MAMLADHITPPSFAIAIYFFCNFVVRQKSCLFFIPKLDASKNSLTNLFPQFQKFESCVITSLMGVFCDHFTSLDCWLMMILINNRYE